MKVRYEAVCFKQLRYSSLEGGFPDLVLIVLRRRCIELDFRIGLLIGEDEDVEMQ